MSHIHKTANGKETGPTIPMGDTGHTHSDPDGNMVQISQGGDDDGHTHDAHSGRTDGPTPIVEESE